MSTLNEKGGGVSCAICNGKETMDDPCVRACQLHEIHISCWEDKHSDDSPFECAACSKQGSEKGGVTMHLPVPESCMDVGSLQSLLDQNANVDIATICQRYNLTLQELIDMGLTKRHFSYILGGNTINQVFTAPALLKIGLTAKIAVEQLDLECEDILRNAWKFPMVKLLGFDWELMKRSITDRFVRTCEYTDEQWEELGAGSEEKVYQWLNLID